MRKRIEWSQSGTVEMNGRRWGKQARPLRPRLRSRLCRMWLCGALAPLAACGDNGEPPSSAMQVVDSAGIRIVTHAATDRVYATVAAEPVFSLGLLDGPAEFLFGRIASVAIGPAGTLIVADGQSNEIRLFDAEGNHLRTLGGPGEGPGEFGRLERAWSLAGGEIVAADRARITRFGADGELVNSETISDSPLRVIGHAGPDAMLIGVQLRDAFDGMREGMMEDALIKSQIAYLLRHTSDGLLDTLTLLKGPSTQIDVEGSGTNMSIQIMRVPLAPNPSATTSAAGRIAVTGGASYEIMLYGTDGALEQIVRLAEEPPLRTEAHLEAYVGNSVRMGPSGERETMDAAALNQAVSRYAAMPIPERLPAWNNLVIGDDGRIWARRFAVPGTPTIVRDVFSAEGHYLGKVTMPTDAGRQLEQVVEERLVVIATDDLGVQRVAFHALQYNSSQ